MSGPKFSFIDTCGYGTPWGCGKWLKVDRDWAPGKFVVVHGVAKEGGCLPGGGVYDDGIRTFHRECLPPNTVPGVFSRRLAEELAREGIRAGREQQAC